MSVQLLENTAKHIQKVLQLCDKHFFIRPIIVNDSEFSHYKYGPAGELLKNNIHYEWYYNNVINSQHNMFPYCTNILGPDIQGLQEAFQYVKELSNGQLPFGIANISLDPQSKQISKSEESKYFHPKQQNVMRTYSYIQPRNSSQFFDQWQRHRKMWWRKISALPGRYSLSDIRNTDNGQEVEIQASFPWGQETVEKIFLEEKMTNHYLDKSNREIFEARDGSKKVIPHVVQTVSSVESVLMTLLCDAYEESQFQDQHRTLLKFHRKIAPYKISFGATAPNAKLGEDLKNLALYLTKQLRKAGISTFLLPDLAKRTLEYQFIRSDELGIPYTVVLNETTLKNGIIGLRSRDTTLKEQVHVTEIKKYAELLLDNY